MWQVVGHEEAVALLSRSMEKDMLSHAYLFVGPPQVGKTTLAINLAQAVNCLEPPELRPCGQCGQCRRIAARQHSDVQVIDLVENTSGTGTRKLISIDQVREVQHSATLKPYEGRCRVFIFQEASLLSADASNALLKLLEEPPESVLFILLTANGGAIFPTIVSRCQWIGLNFPSFVSIAEELQRLFELSLQDAMKLARVSRGRIGWALEAAKNPQIMADYAAEMERVASLLDDDLVERFAYAEEVASLYTRDPEKALERLRVATGWWRDLLLLKEGGEANIPARETLKNYADWVSVSEMVKVLRATQDTVDYLESNINPRLAMEVLMLSLPRRA